MNPDIERLLTLQRDDAEIDGLQRRLDELDAGAKALERERTEAAAAVEKARADVAAEEKKQRELHSRFSEHKQLQEKNLAQLDAVKKAREATAAMSQIDERIRLLEQLLQLFHCRRREDRRQLFDRCTLAELNERLKDLPQLRRAKLAGIDPFR